MHTINTPYAPLSTHHHYTSSLPPYPSLLLLPRTVVPTPQPTSATLPWPVLSPEDGQIGFGATYTSVRLVQTLTFQSRPYCAAYAGPLLNTRGGDFPLPEELYMGELAVKKACTYMDAFSLAQPADTTAAMTAYQQV